MATSSIGLHERSTIGAMYQYMHFGFTRIFSSTDSHAIAASYSLAISRSTQLSAFGGVSRYETIFVQTVAIDPAIAALIGISSAERVSYQKNYTPYTAFRLSKTVPRGTIFVQRFAFADTRKRAIPDFDFNQRQRRV